MTCNGDNDTRAADTEHLASLLWGYMTLVAKTRTEIKSKTGKGVRLHELQNKSNILGRMRDATQLIKEKRMKNRGDTDGENKKYTLEHGLKYRHFIDCI